MKPGALRCVWLVLGSGQRPARAQDLPDPGCGPAFHGLNTNTGDWTFHGKLPGPPACQQGPGPTESAAQLGLRPLPVL